MPATLTLVVVFALLLGGIRARLGLATSIVGASFALAMLRGLSWLQWLGALPAALLSRQTVLLAVMITVILVFSSVYAASGQSARFLAAVRGRIASPELLVTFFPALIGLLPMPGGAIFSAPMVAQAAADLDLSPEDQSLINYWFRHVWELAWPLYPGIILAASLARMPVAEVLAFMWPGPMVAMALGWWWILRPARSRGQWGRFAQEGAPVSGLLDGLPLAVAIGGAVLGEWGCARLLPHLPMEWAVVVAMVAAAGVSLVRSQAQWRLTLQEAAQNNIFGLLAVVAAVFVFKEVLARGQVVDALAAELGGGGAVVLLAVVLPFVVGSISGITMAFVGATFPLLFGLATSTGQQAQIPALLCLGLYSGFAGIMASPMHICYLVTCRYFRVDPARLLPRIALPSLMFIPVGLVSYLVLA
jgi:integral membrane protein (TIGR00529 family)